MSYLIKNTQGELLTTVLDNSADGPDTSGLYTLDINLIGRNFSNYGGLQNQNFVRLLEHFAGPNSPGKPIPGQLWFDTSDNRLKVRTSTNTWRPTANVAISVSSTAPNQIGANAPVTGDLYYNTTTQQYNVFDGIDWTVVGPPYSGASGKAGAIRATVGGKTVIKLYSDGHLIAIFAWEQTAPTSSEITTEPELAGFATIYAGLTLNSALNNGVFAGTATNSNKLGTVESTSYARKDIDESFSANISLASGKIALKHDTQTATISSTVSTKDFNLAVNVNGTITNALIIKSSNGEVRTTVTPGVDSDNSVVTNKGYVDNKISNALGSYAPLASPQFTGTPKSSAELLQNDSSDNLATTAFVQTSISTSKNGLWQGSKRIFNSKSPIDPSLSGADADLANSGTTQNDFWIQTY